MNFKDSPEEAAFRKEVRTWLESNVPAVAAPGAGTGDDVAAGRAWQRKLAEGGWAGIAWPKEYGGRGASASEAVIFGEELARFRVPQGPFLISQGLVGPTLIVHGTEEQKQRHLEPILSGDEVWCQLWSEPEAGSDVASLRTRAERDTSSGNWVLNGQKVWTSFAHEADYGICIARTDPDVPKHRGITCFIIDMKTPGVTVRPLRQITGDAHFNEVFFDDAVVPPENVVGDVNDGWRVAITVLMNERHAIVGDTRGVKAQEVLDLARKVSVDGRTVSEDPVLRQDLADLYIRSKLVWLLGCRLRTKQLRGRAPGPEGSVGKLFRSDLGTRIAAVAGRILGAEAVRTDTSATDGGRWGWAWLQQPGPHLAGGTDEIQRNIIGERVLGLPKEPQVDRDMPFKEIGKRR